MVAGRRDMNLWLWVHTECEVSFRGDTFSVGVTRDTWLDHVSPAWARRSRALWIWFRNLQTERKDWDQSETEQNTNKQTHSLSIASYLGMVHGLFGANTHKWHKWCEAKICLASGSSGSVPEVAFRSAPWRTHAGSIFEGRRVNLHRVEGARQEVRQDWQKEFGQFSK